jgi:hypothetical protein
MNRFEIRLYPADTPLKTVARQAECTPFRPFGPYQNAVTWLDVFAPHQLTDRCKASLAAGLGPKEPCQEPKIIG